MNYKEDNFVRVGKYKNCLRCDGRGEYRCQVSYYDTDWVECECCGGSGQKLIETKITTRCDQPFPLAKD